MGYLGQVLAVDKRLRNRVEPDVNKLYKELQKADLFAGFTKTYQPIGDPEDPNTDIYPPESKVVQKRAEDVIRELKGLFGELFDVTATKDWANLEARADVITSEGDVLLPNVPATYLLFLEKWLVHFGTIVSKLPLLDPSEVWTWDDTSKCFRTAPIKTHKTKKVKKAIVAYPHSDKHPAQAQVYDADEVIGYWSQTKFSGALEKSRRDELAKRIASLLDAVRAAREVANRLEVEQVKTADKVFGYLFD